MEWQRDLSVSFNKLGDVERAAGDLGAARKRYEAALSIFEALAALDPDNAGRQRDVFVSNAKLGQVADAEKDISQAVDRFAEAERIMAALIETRPDHPGFARDLAQVRSDLARLRGEG